jgi:hypothetical protein
MAKVGNGFLGDAVGKIGNVIFNRWKGISVARKYQPIITDAKSPGQLAQRSKFKTLLYYLAPLNMNFIKFLNGPRAHKTTPWALAIQENPLFIDKSLQPVLANLNLGYKNFSTPTILLQVFDAFLDQTTILIDENSINEIKTEFSNITTSVIGQITRPGPIGFNTQNVCVPLTGLYFFCSLDIVDPIAQEWAHYTYLQCWEAGKMWIECFDISYE